MKVSVSPDSRPEFKGQAATYSQLDSPRSGIDYGPEVSSDVERAGLHDTFTQTSPGPTCTIVPKLNPIPETSRCSRSHSSIVSERPRIRSISRRAFAKLSILFSVVQGASLLLRYEGTVNGAQISQTRNCFRNQFQRELYIFSRVLLAEAETDAGFRPIATQPHCG